MAGIVAALVYIGDQTKPAATRVFLPEATTAIVMDRQQPAHAGAD
jgi:hypothetical protein